MPDLYTSAPDAGEREPEGVASGIARAMGGEPPEAPQPGPYDDDATLLEFFKTFKDECSEDRQSYEREWWRKLMYALGRQWIYYDRKRGWQDKRLTKWTPKPVTNVIAEVIDTTRSVFNSVQLSIVARPNGQDPGIVAAAELANELEPCIAQEHEIKSRTRESDFWLASLHSVFWHVWWDKRSDTNGSLVVPHESCTACGTTAPPAAMMAGCPHCGNTATMPAQDDGGQPVGDVHRVGKGATDVLSPFEVLVPPTYARFADIPGLIRQRWRTTRWWKENHPELASSLAFCMTPTDKSLQLIRSLSTQTDLGTSMQVMGGGGDSGPGSEGLVEYELWYKPCDRYPDGLFLRVAGDTAPKVIHDDDESTPGPLPHQTADGQRFFPWMMQVFSQFGGRIWGRGNLDGILSKQDQINQIDSLIQLIIQRMANPIWLKPKGSEVQSFTGEPGLVVEWNPLAAGGMAKPERIPGENVPPSLMAIRKQLMDDVDRSTGAYDIMRGQKPAGVEAFSALQLLVERSQSRFGQALAERGECYRQWYGLALELERAYGPQERTWAMLGPNRRWTIQKFQSANLQGSVEIVVEDGSQMPKTNLGKRAAIEQANQLQMIDPKDPDQRYAVFRDFGITHLLPALDANVKSALQEQDALERWFEKEMPGPFPMVVKAWHDDPVHLAEHKKWANGDNVRDMLASYQPLEAGLTEHFKQHEQAAMMKELPPNQRAQLQAGQGLPAAQVANQTPKPPTPQGAALAMAGSNRESANPADLPGAVGGPGQPAA